MTLSKKWGYTLMYHLYKMWLYSQEKSLKRTKYPCKKANSILHFFHQIQILYIHEIDFSTLLKYGFTLNKIVPPQKYLHISEILLI